MRYRMVGLMNTGKHKGSEVRNSIARDITLAMAIKLVLLAVLFALFAHPAHQPVSDAAATAAAVAGTPGSSA
jgi:hypothetical protein